MRYDLLSDQSFSNNALNSVLLSEADWDVQTSQTKSERELSCGLTWETNLGKTKKKTTKYTVCFMFKIKLYALKPYNNYNY